MDAKSFFLEQYVGFREYPWRLVSGLTERQQRGSSHPSINPIVWVLWHVARCEDVGVNRIVVDRNQVFDDGGWAARLGVGERSMGTGMSKEEVLELCETIDLSQLNAYGEAVSDRTKSVVHDLPAAELSSELTRKHLRRVFVDEGAGGADADAIVDAFCGRTKGWLLGHLALTHQFYHMGQAFGIRSMYGVSSPW